MFKGALLRKSIFRPVLEPQPGEGIWKPLPFVVNGCSPCDRMVQYQPEIGETTIGSNVLLAVVTVLHHFSITIDSIKHHFSIALALLSTLLRLYSLSQCQ